MPTDVDVICRFHESPGFKTREDMLARSREAERAYRSLSESDVSDLAAIAIEGDRVLRKVLVALACLRPGCLKPFHERILERGIVSPGLIYHDAEERTASRLAERLDVNDGTLRRNHLLLCMAWAGNAEVQRQFSRWRESPPSWVNDLCVPPHAYSTEAGWELSANGDRRDLFFRSSFPLVKRSDGGKVTVGVDVGVPTGETCPWCHRPLISFLDLDARADSTAFLALRGTRLRVLVCDVCSAFGVVYSKNDGTGQATWHPANVRPVYLPDASDWDPFPQRPLTLGGQQRHFMESASWTMMPEQSFSQIGGLPTWVQDAEHPACPECSQTMMFVGQISHEDYDGMAEGIHYCFVCRECNVTAATYQQS